MSSHIIIMIKTNYEASSLRNLLEHVGKPSRFANKVSNFFRGINSGARAATVEAGSVDNSADPIAASMQGTFDGSPAEGDTISINGVDLTFVDAFAHLEEQDLTYSAAEAGPDGDDISIEYALPAEEEAELSVDVTDEAILVNLATDAGDNAELIVQDITYTAANPGAAGNDITIEYVSPLSGTHPLSVDVVDTAITVNLESEAAVAATGDLDLTDDIVLTSVALGAARNTNTFTIQVLAPAANPTDTVLVDFTGTAAAIVCTVTPNDGTNNAATPVDLTTAELAELINTGAVVGKTVTVTDAGSLRDDQTATGGGAANLADGGEGDGVVATFANGLDFVPSVSTATEVHAAIEGSVPASGLVSVAISGTAGDVQVAAAETPLAGGGENIASISTADDILAAIEESAEASALVTVEVTGTGSDVQIAFGPENLDGGELPGNNEISISGSPSDAELAERTVEAINSSTTDELVGVVEAEDDGAGSFTVSCKIPGVIGNSIVLADDADGFSWADDATALAEGAGRLPSLSQYRFSR